MAKFINPFTDVGFKRIFGQEVSKDLLIDFLNDLLVDERHIKDIRFLDKELLPEFEGDRGVIYDIYCTDENGDHFIVEMQNKQQINFKERTLFYLSHAITRQGERGAEWMFDLKAVYGVFFMNFALKDAPRKLRTDIVLADRETHETFSDKLRFIFIELPSFKKTEEECENDFEQVAIQRQLQASALYFHQTLGNIQSQTAAFSVAGGIATDKPLQQFLGSILNILPGDILHRQKYLILFLGKLHVNPGAGGGIFHRIAQ